MEKPKALSTIQLQTRVVPFSLRRVVLSAWHAPPLSIHIGTEETFWCIAIQLWCPIISHQVWQWVHSCVHWRTANITDEPSTTSLHMMDSADPLNTIFVGVYYLDKIPTNWGEKKFLWIMEEVTGFVGGSSTKDKTSDMVGRNTFTTSLSQMAYLG